MIIIDAYNNNKIRTIRLVIDGRKDPGGVHDGFPNPVCRFQLKRVGRLGCARMNRVKDRRSKVYPQVFEG